MALLGLLPIALACNPTRVPAAVTGDPAPTASSRASAPSDAKSCAVISTDDDIPSGSATAGALYVAEAELGRKLLTRDVIAAAQGFLDAGIRCVIVLDSHDGAIDKSALSAMPGVSVLTPSNDTSWTWPFLGSSVERALVGALIGFHSRADQPTGFRAHTINDSVAELRINDEPAGEVVHGIIGFGAFDVPVVLVSGDMNATAEAAAIVPSIEQVAVRWRDKQGGVQFLSSEDAARRLREAAKKGAHSKIEPYRPALPIRVGLRMRSKGTTEDLSRTLANEFAHEAKESRWESRLGAFDFARALRVEQNQVSWTAPNAVSAYVSIAFAASRLRGPNNFEIVTRGFDAYRHGQYEEAIAAYEEALRVNPHDMATHCRIGAVLQKVGKLEQARQRFRTGVEHEDEMEDAMKSWCAVGLAQTELASGNRAAAREAARHALELPDFGTRHAEAHEILATIEKKRR